MVVDVNVDVDVRRTLAAWSTPRAECRELPSHVHVHVHVHVNVNVNVNESAYAGFWGNARLGTSASTNTVYSAGSSCPDCDSFFRMSSASAWGTAFL